MTGAVFWDTNLFIYLIEERPAELRNMVVLGRGRMTREGSQLVTSALTLGEILVHPLRARRSDLAQRYSELVTAGALVVPLDAGAARRYAEARATYPTVRPPDAVQLACAAHHGVDLFVTNDRRLDRVRIRGIGRVAALSDWVAG